MIDLHIFDPMLDRRIVRSSRREGSSLPVPGGRAEREAVLKAASLLSRPEGFVLPVALGTLTLLSLLATAGWVLSVIELRRSQTHRAAVEAFYAADGALQAFVGASPVPLDSATPYMYRIAGAATTVSLEPLLDLENGDLLMRAMARAFLRPPEGGKVRRSVGSVLLVLPELRPPGAMTLWNTLQSAGSSGTVSGLDAAPAPGCLTSPDVAGIAGLSAPPSLGGLTLLGNPPVVQLSSASALADSTGLRWRALVGPGGPRPDAEWPRDPWPLTPPGERWPLIKLARGASLGQAESGRGALLATGELELSDGFSWEGILLVAGAVRITGRVRITGALLAGLDSVLGAPQPGNELASDDVQILFHSCNVVTAARRLALPLTPVPGSWYEEMTEPP
ncbi:MAG: hypothetical protein ACE5HP_12715 [Gemmatimonadota bacterium]